MTVVNNQQIQVPTRLEYSAPQIVQFGSVSDLTAGGSGLGQECKAKGGNPTCKP